jgi:tRNA dimethylallyltransferase
VTSPDLIAIFGPTGVGKTTVALALADALTARGERPVAVSADSLQIYAGLEILTGAADADAQRRLEHRLISCVPVGESFSAGRYAELAHAEIDGLIREGRRPILVGGTGLYLRAALTELSLKPPVDPALRAQLTARLADEGPAALHAELTSRAPAVAAKTAPTDRQRITRALELLEAGWDPEQPEDELWTAHTRIPTTLVGLTLGREALYRQIEARIEAMLAAGAREEVQRAAALGAGPTASKAVGFRELLAGDVEAMKVNTRRYAKRQLTWMRKLPGVTLIDLGEVGPEAAAARILELIDAH